MNSIEKATDLYQVWAPDFTAEVLKKAQKGVEGAVKLGDAILDNIQIPIITDDAQVKKYIEEFELYKPKNMIRFFVEASFAVMEQIKDEVDSQKENELDNIISRIDSAKCKIIHGIDNPQERRKKFYDAQNDLFDATENLKKKFDQYVKTIRDVDNRAKWNFFLKSHLSVNEVINTNRRAKKTINALLAAMELQIMIANQLGQNISNSVVIPFRRFVEGSIIKNDTCSLLHAYDLEKEEEFWLELPNKLSKVGIVQEQLEDFLGEFDEDDEEIDFN